MIRVWLQATPPSPVFERTVARRVRRVDPLLVLLVLYGSLSVACGKKGPPLPPIIRLPAAPAQMTAERQADLVDISFIVPDSNTDGTRPADVERVDVYGFTGARSTTDADILKLGMLVGSIEVKSPSDPNDTIEQDEPVSDLEPLTGSGLDQGATAKLTESLTRAVRRPVDMGERARPGASSTTPVLLPAPVPFRTYIAIAVSTHGRRGAASGRAVVPLVATPPTPPAPEVSYDERAVTVSWAVAGDQSSEAEEVLASRSIWPSEKETAFNVYEVEPVDPGFGAGTPSVATRLTLEPRTEPPFIDERIQWNVERCYAIRLVRRLDGLAVESEDSAPTCLVMADVFPPPVPAGLRAIASDAAINLIWEPVSAQDLAGYVVLRGVPGQSLQPIAASPIQETAFRDDVPSGSRFVYAVQAVDAAGNASGPSQSEAATAR